MASTACTDEEPADYDPEALSTPAREHDWVEAKRRSSIPARSDEPQGAVASVRLPRPVKSDRPAQAVKPETRGGAGRAPLEVLDSRGTRRQGRPCASGQGLPRSPSQTGPGPAFRRLQHAERPVSRRRVRQPHGPVQRVDSRFALRECGGMYEESIVPARRWSPRPPTRSPTGCRRCCAGAGASEGSGSEGSRASPGGPSQSKWCGCRQVGCYILEIFDGYDRLLRFRSFLRFNAEMLTPCCCRP